jgi:dihydrodipicolinate synthase/N-acetylneuraminate lyase
MAEEIQDGVYAALVTPYRAGESVDLDALAALVGHVADAGCRGVVTTGSTGEFHLLRPSERRAVLETTVGAAGNRLAVIAHVGAPTTRVTARLAEHAASVGASAVLVVTPYYHVVDAPAGAAHLRAVADAVRSVPVLAYSMPGLAGTRWDDDVLDDLAGDGTIRGAKDSGSDLVALRALTAAHPGFAGFTGNASLLREAAAAGLAGGILALANIVPEVLVELEAASRAGDDARAEALEDSLRPLIVALAQAPGTIGIRAATAQRFGIPGTARRPIPAALPEQRAAIAAALEEALAAAAC